jgi:hypothetical protein
VTLTDVQGKTVYTADVSGLDVITIPVASLAAGSYLVNVSTDAGNLTRKITVSR